MIRGAIGWDPNDNSTTSPRRQSDVNKVSHLPPRRQNLPLPPVTAQVQSSPSLPLQVPSSPPLSGQLPAANSSFEEDCATCQAPPVAHRNYDHLA